MLDTEKTKAQLISELEDARQRLAAFGAGEAPSEPPGDHLRELADFVRFNPAPVLRLARDGRILCLNPAAEKILGSNRVGTSAYGIFPGLKGVDPREIDPDIPVRLESRLGDKYFTFAAVASGRDDSMYVYGADITEHKQAEEALRQRKELFRTLLDNAGDAIYLADASGRFLEVNREAERQTSFSRDHLLGMGIPDLDLNQSPELFSAFASVMAKKRTAFFETRHRRKDGSHFSVELKVVRLESEAGPVFIGIARDTTGRKQAEEAWRVLDKSYRELVEYAPIGIFQTTPQGRYLLANTWLARMYGYDSAQELMDSVWDIGSQLYVNANERQDIKRAVGRGVADNLECRRRRRDGSVIWVALSIRAVRDRAGKVQRYEGFALDITEKVLAKNALKEALDKADTANRAKSEFLANMTHEIRTPLNGVLGMLQLLEISELTAEQQDYVATCLASANTLLELIDSIIDLARIEAGRLGIVEGEFLFSELCHGLPSLFEAQLKAKRLGFAVDIAPSVPSYIVGDAGRIRQVLVNLIGNAVKFTMSGGVTVRIEAGENVGPGRMKLRFSVSDTGIGIPEDQIPRLFTPFTQADGSTTRRYQGSGLGLSLVRRLVELMGGEARIESELGRGTTVRFDILVGVPQEDAAASPTPGQPQA